MGILAMRTYIVILETIQALASILWGVSILWGIPASETATVFLIASWVISDIRLHIETYIMIERIDNLERRLAWTEAGFQKLERDLARIEGRSV